MSPLLRVNNLSKNFDGHQVLHDINFTVEKGETFGLFGDSGSGKTTIGRSIVGLEKPDGGEILFRDDNLLTMNRGQMRRIRPKIQMIFQHPEMSLNPKMKAFDSLVEPMMIHERPVSSSIPERVDELLELVGLRGEHLDRYPAHLSGGEIQRIVLARILSIRPEFIVADEPTSMLDVSVQAQVLRIMEKIQDETGISYLLISHDIDVLQTVCDRIGYLEDGQISYIEDV
ncbi:peptide/nickel transport system ATP-binding protein [Methanohalophilus levihalophilus]|uniref:ABC transporter ATP-binding protein n=1 Tax=Methanohalophilus levihalophilus TaxID=1431282 RepID=UPI001AE3F9F8|nr:dipeptide/oligopeptide/nickel ABC transporter ATP-binding protein [Methanohalophilus levihalophilus]MBP2030790.1 peptide/nickel transport system ATP-binding protein [Methanohalophilus levihalophilus]